MTNEYGASGSTGSTPYGYGQYYQAAKSNIGGWYSQYLGRPAGDSEIDSHLSNLGYKFDDKPISNLSYLQQQIANSPEAQAWAAKQKQPQQAATVTTTTAAPAPKKPAAEAAPTQAAPTSGGSDIERASYVSQLTLPEYRPFAFKQVQVDPYQAGSVSQFTAPTFSADPAQQALLTSLLQSPHSLNDQVTGQMKERYKEDTLRGTQQQIEQQRMQAGARGTLDGGRQQANERRMQEQALASVLGSNRDIDINRAVQNKQDELAALGISDQVLNGALGRATSGYQTQLTGQMSQEQLRQAAAESALRTGQFDFSQQLAGADENARAQGFNQDNQRVILQALGLDENARQADQGLGLGYANLGFNYANLDANTKMKLLQMILGGGVGV